VDVVFCWAVLGSTHRHSCVAGDQVADRLILAEAAADIARLRERRHWTVPQWEAIAGKDWPAAVARCQSEADAAVDRLLAAARAGERYREALREIASCRCLTGWGESGLKSPPSCSCVVCEARAALRSNQGEG
jgi:hypothetical protein